MNRFKSIIAAAIAVVAAVSYALPAQPVSAQSSAALSIVPKKNYSIEPGKTIKDKLTIRNLDDKKPLNLTLRIVDFTFTDDGGTPKLFLAEDAPQTTWSLKPFLKVPEEVTIAPKESKTIDMSVAIPAGLGAGSYYSAIIYSSGTPNGGNVGLNASGVTLAFAQVPGKVDESLKLEKFGSYIQAAGDQKAHYSTFMTDEPQVMAYTLKNSGNVTEAPAGNITIKSMFGKEYAIDNVNPNESLALIGQSRTYTACIKLKSADVDFNGEKTKAKSCTPAGLWPGYYTASLDLFYGQNGNKTQEIIGTSSFWYMPWWFIILLVILLAIIVFVTWRAVTIVRRKLYGPQRTKTSSKRK